MKRSGSGGTGSVRCSHLKYVASGYINYERAGGEIAGVTLMGAVVFGQSLDGYAYLGIGLILAGVIVLNALSTAASG